jgi:hypothetical protein
MELLARELDVLYLLIADRDLGGVGVGVEACVDLQAGAGRGRGDQVDHGLAGEERLGAPVDRDVAEEPVLDLVPLTGPRSSVHLL